MEPIQPPSSAPRSSLEDLLVELRPALGRILGRFRIPRADAEDLVQEVLLQFVRKRAAIAAPATWLTGALHRECLHYWRRRDRRLFEAIDETVAELVRDESTPPAERQVLHGELRQVFRHLKETCRSLLSLRYGMGCGQAETAERLGYRPSSMDKITRRCLDALGRRLAAAGKAHGDA